MLEANGVTGVLRRHGKRAAHRFVGNGCLVRRTCKVHQRIVAGNGGNIQLPGQRDGCVLIANGAQGIRRRADEAQPGRFGTRGKVGALCQKAVARIDGVNAVLIGNAQDGLNVVVFLHVVDVFGGQVGDPRRGTVPIGNPFLGRHNGVGQQPAPSAIHLQRLKGDGATADQQRAHRLNGDGRARMFQGCRGRWHGVLVSGEGV